MTAILKCGSPSLGQAAVNIAAQTGARVIATTRNSKRAPMLKSLGAGEVMLESPGLATPVRERHPNGIDAVLDIVGNTTVLDSLAMLRGGQVCLVGFLGGGGPLALEPVFQMPSGRRLSVFASALVTGTPDFPLAEIPFQDIVDRVAAGVYKAKPAQVFGFAESNQANGKLVVRL
jgi:NADPH2:quinone reductase